MITTPPDTISLQELIRAITWRSADDPCVAKWSRIRSQTLRECLSAWARRDPRVETVVAACDDGAPESVERALSRPRVAFELLKRQQERSLTRLDIVAAALVEELSGAADSAGAALTSGTEYLRIDGSGHSMLCDWRSDFPFPQGGDTARGLVPYSPPEIPSLRAKIVQAWQSMQLVPRAFDFSSTFTTLVAARREPSTDRLTSGSFSGYAGLTLLTNVHVLSADLASLVDALVHEAIHGALYLFELLRQPLLLARLGPTIRSPWSGNCLSLDSYVQACFVWSGLFNFWNFESSAAIAADDRRQALRLRALNGFRHRPVTKLLLPVADHCLHPETRQGLLSVEELMLQSL